MCIRDRGSAGSEERRWVTFLCRLPETKRLHKEDYYLLPRFNNTLDKLSGAQRFPSLDLKRRYWQVDLLQEDTEKTDFSTPSSLFQFKVIPFGLFNAPATFERLIDLVL